MTPDFAFLDAPEVSAPLFHPRRCEAANGLEPTETWADGATLGGLWLDRPTLLLHGASDSLIPPAAARENFTASAAAWRRLVEIPGAGHNDLLFRAREGDLYFGPLRDLRAAATTTTRPITTPSTI